VAAALMDERPIVIGDDLNFDVPSQKKYDGLTSS
jgi:hypothetical protein